MRDATNHAAPARLEVRDLVKSYGNMRALKGVSLSIAPGEIHGLCGHNGAGKSTLVKIISGLIRPDQGSLSVDGEEISLRSPQHAQGVGVALVDQEISLIDPLSVSDNVLLGLIGAPFLQRPAAAAVFVRGLRARVGLAEIDPGTPAGQLSMGQRQLVEIARALGRDARLLILDEPTATLSVAETEQVFASLRPLAAAGASIVFVSHRLGEVLHLCDRVTVLRDGEVVAAAEATAGLDRRTLVEMMVGDIHDDEVQRQPPASSSAPSLSIRALAVPGRLHDFDLDVSPGQIVGLAGQVGSGATDALRALAGLAVGAEGRVLAGDRLLRLGSPLASRRVGLEFLSNDRKGEGLFLENSVGRNLIATRLGPLSRLGFIRAGAAAKQQRELSELVGLDQRVKSPVGDLSGGNQQKAFIGRSLERGTGRVLLLDEPTRGVDVAGRADIHALVRGAAAAGNAVVFASTESDEILDLADVVVTLYAGRRVAVRRREDVTMSRLVAEMTAADDIGVA